MIFDYLKLAIKPYHARIYQHPFNQALSSGTLPMTMFHSFLQQDEIYLRCLSNTLKNIAERVPNQYHQKIFMQLSHDAKKTAEKLHHKYLLEPQKFSFYQPAFVHTIPAITQYTHFLEQTSNNDSISASIVSVLPCFYIYSMLGTYINQKGISRTNPYRLWIESYSNERFRMTTAWLIDYLNQIHNDGSDPQELILTFIQSTQFEIAFWDSIFWGHHKLQINKAMSLEREFPVTPV